MAAIAQVAIIEGSSNESAFPIPVVRGILFTGNAEILSGGRKLTENLTISSNVSKDRSLRDAI